MDARSRRWLDAWTALQGPLSFSLGAFLLVFEAIKTLSGHVIDGELVIAACGLCGLPMFAPVRDKES